MSSTDERNSVRTLIVVVSVVEGLMLAALFIVLIALYAKTSDQAGVTSCQSRYIQQLSAVLQKRAALGDENTAATATLAAAVQKYPPGSTRRAQAYASYKVTVTAITVQRAHTPIPAAPACGAS